jgi:glycine betaine catabolism B
MLMATDVTILDRPAGETDNSAQVEDRIVIVCRGIIPETPDTKSYLFARADGRPVSFRAGQFLTFHFPIAGEEVVRSYSISSSAACVGLISVTVKRIEGGLVSNWLFNKLAVGDTIEVDEPAGLFVPTDHVRSPLLLISAGSGITPMASTLRTLADRGADADVIHIHFAQSLEDMTFLDEMQHWSRRLPRARIIPVATRPRPGTAWIGPTGRISLPLLQALAPDVSRRIVFCCGPQGFMEQTRALAVDAGVSPDAYHEESFCPLEPGSASDTTETGTTFKVHFSKSQASINCGPETTLARAASAANVRLQTSCGQGICGTCRTKLVSGTVDMSHKGGIKEREIDQGWILACCSRPTSDVVIDR